MQTYPNLDPNRPDVVRPTRIDLYQNPGGLFVLKFSDGWTASTPAYDRHLTPDWTIDAAARWLEENGWTVRRWPGGARAWLGRLLPIRTRAQIARKREQLLRSGPPDPAIQIHTLDLAFDL